MKNQFTHNETMRGGDAAATVWLQRRRRWLQRRRRWWRRWWWRRRRRRWRSCCCRLRSWRTMKYAPGNGGSRLVRGKTVRRRRRDLKRCECGARPGLHQLTRCTAGTLTRVRRVRVADGRAAGVNAARRRPPPPPPPPSMCLGEPMKTFRAERRPWDRGSADRRGVHSGRDGGDACRRVERRPGRPATWRAGGRAGGDRSYGCARQHWRRRRRRRRRTRGATLQTHA